LSFPKCNARYLSPPVFVALQWLLSVLATGYALGLIGVGGSSESIVWDSGSYCILEHNELVFGKGEEFKVCQGKGLAIPWV